MSSERTRSLAVAILLILTVGIGYYTGNLVVALMFTTGFGIVVTLWQLIKPIINAGKKVTVWTERKIKDIASQLIHRWRYR